jgi:hypothetical protein
VDLIYGKPAITRVGILEVSRERSFFQSVKSHQLAGLQHIPHMPKKQLARPVPHTDYARGILDYTGIEWMGEPSDVFR